jgi:hypothetical protein
MENYYCREQQVKCRSESSEREEVEWNEDVAEEKSAAAASQVEPPVSKKR